MATIIVNTTLDENGGSIESVEDIAIAYADSQPGADTITFASGAGEAFETGGTIRLDAALGGTAEMDEVRRRPGHGNQDAPPWKHRERNQ